MVTFSCAQGLLLLLYSKITPDEIQGPHEVLYMEPGFAVSKASSCTISLTLRIYISNIFSDADAIVYAQNLEKHRENLSQRFFYPTPCGTQESHMAWLGEIVLRTQSDLAV